MDSGICDVKLPTLLDRGLKYDVSLSQELAHFVIYL